MKSWKQNIMLFAFGGAAYTGLELLWRGHSHWTMTLTGGCVFVGLTELAEKLAGERVLMRAAAGGLCITTAELLVGLTVNRGFLREVWDYSAYRGNVMGQICPQFGLLWAGLSIPAMELGKKMKEKMKNA